MTRPAIFRYFKTSPEIIRVAVMMDARLPLSLRNVEDLLHERGSSVALPFRIRFPSSGSVMPRGFAGGMVA